MVEDDEDTMELEEGELEDTLQTGVDEVLFGSPRNYYSLQVEETTDERSQIVGSSHIKSDDRVEPSRFVPAPQTETTKRQTELLFSPEGNEGFMLTTIPSDAASHNSPRVINEDLLMRRYNYTQSGDMLPLRRDLQDKLEGDIASVRTSLTSMKLTPRKNFDAPFEETFHSGAESTASPRSGGYLTDRATSPSAASVTSLQSVSSQVSVSGRRFLEWDYGSDLGYVDGQLTQVEAAQSLSTLEKLAIGNYTEYLKDSSEDGEDERRVSRRQLLQDNFDEENNVRMRKFAESLMRQRQLRETKHPGRRSSDQTGKSDSPNKGSREPLRSPRDQEESLQPQSLPPSDSVVRSPSEVFSPEKTRHHKSGVMQRSTSLTEVSGLVRERDRNKSLSIIQLSPRQVKTNQMSGPSSSSSGGTVVPANKLGTRASKSSEHESLPSHLEDILIETEAGVVDGISMDPGPRTLTLSSQVSKLSQNSRQSSRRSITNSFETVIAAERFTSSEKDSIDTEEEVLNVNVEDQGARHVEPRASEPRPRRVNNGVGGPRLSGNSSLPSTSDEDNERRRRQEGRGHLEDTSTLESVQLIDRAKSFEYIPGESFPLQENSSSYEYLPGHLVPEQRPPTVLNLASEEVARDVLPSSNSSSPSTRQEQINNKELETLTRELRGKSRELLAANLSQTKQFFKKLKRYIDFLSTPSESVAECRAKQQLAMKITKLLSSEESRLELSGLSRPESSVSGKSRQETATSRTDSQPRGRSDTGQSSSLESLEAKLRDWKVAKTRSEEKYEKKEKSVHKSMRSVDELNRKRIEHLVNLKREIKILERMERGGGAGGQVDQRYSENRTKMEGISTPSSNSQLVKSTDSPTRKLTYKKTSGGTASQSTATENSSLPRDTVEAREGEEGSCKSVVDAGTQMDPIESDLSSALSLLSESSRRSVTKYKAGGRILSHTETVQVHAKFESHTEESLLGAPPVPGGDSSTTPTIESSTCLSSTLTSRCTGEEATYWNKENRRMRREKVSRRRKAGKRSKSVAYYLPIDNMSPIRIGKKILKDSYANEEGLHKAKHRDILSQYMATVNSEPLRPRVTIPSRPRDKPFKPTKLSLQEALLENNPAFVRQSEERVAILREIRRIREQRTERKNAWLDEVRCLSPRSKLSARPVFSPSPCLHLFSHREMVSATRNKYSVLPEVVLRKESNRKEGRNETNRLRAQIFSRQLKRKVEKGKVSLNHHDRIF